MLTTLGTEIALRLAVLACATPLAYAVALPIFSSDIEYASLIARKEKTFKKIKITKEKKNKNVVYIHLSKPAIIGLVIGVIVLIVFLVILFKCIIPRMKRRKALEQEGEEEEESGEKRPPSSSSTANGPTKPPQPQYTGQVQLNSEPVRKE
ncbi:unnamed protein product [Clonostachys rosea]|uniref:Uncharacterized protein n=1 Tax=Bionectria ochroleuca TaxID=29856 RepID=A0ABY6V1Q0_BIOOC|nr:unnamed protein product [Clonostachys rosea]